MTTVRALRHLPRQLPVLAAFGGALLPRQPCTEVTRAIAPIDRALVRDFVRHVGGDPAAYRDTVPPHLFPHWGLALAARTLAHLRYPLARALNAGCRLEVRAPLPAGCPLAVRAELVSIDDNGTRAALVQRVTTGTADAPDAVVATIHVVIPFARGTPGRRRRAEVPHDARELARWQLGRDAGLAFALLTGDFNPIHWLTRAPILHGFSLLARAIEGVVRARFAGDPNRVQVWDAQFTRPLRIPGDVALLARGDDVWVADAPGGTPYLALATTRSA